MPQYLFETLANYNSRIFVSYYEYQNLKKLEFGILLLRHVAFSYGYKTNIIFILCLKK
jgi:hypothetical protein